MANRTILSNSLKEITRVYTVPTADAFAIWVIAVYHFQNDLSNLESAYDQSYKLLQEGGRGDECLDGYHYEESTRTLYLYQAKYTDQIKKTHGIQDAREVANALNALLSDAKANKPLQGAREQAAQAMRDVLAAEGRVVLRAVSAGKWKKFSTEHAIKSVAHELQHIVHFEAIGVDALIEYAASITEDLHDVAVVFNLYPPPSQSILQFSSHNLSGIGDAVIAIISARSLGEAEQKYKMKLFDKNVRTFLGGGGRVNREIVDALKDDESRKRFWYSHNGITVLCDDLEEIDVGSGSHRLQVTNPQIVNGCQTATSISQAMREGKMQDGDVPILARIIRLVGEPQVKEDVAGTIAFGTNNQSPINLADLRANDSRQKYFEKLLDQSEPPWFYERKRNAWKNIRKQNQARAARYKDTPYRVVQRDIYQQAWRAFAGNPAEAVINKNLVWERSAGGGEGLYEQVFDYDRRSDEIVLVSKLWRWFLEVFKTRNSGSLCIDLNKTLGKHLQELSPAKTLVASYSVALFGHLIAGRHGSLENVDVDQLKKMCNSLDEDSYVSTNWGKKKWKPIERELRLIMTTWSTYCLSLRSEKDTLYRKLKSHGAIEDLKDQIDNQIASEGKGDLFQDF